VFIKEVKRKICQSLCFGFVACGVLLSSVPQGAFAADKPAEAELATPAPTTTDTNSEAVLRSYLQLQDQLHTALLAIEQTKQEADEAAKKNAEMLSAKLTLIEQALTIQQERDSDALKRFNKATVTIAGILGATGLLALILTIAFLFRAMKRLGQVAAGLPPALTMGQTHMLTDSGPAFGGGEPPGHRLLAALDKLEKRIQEMEAKNPGSHQGTNGNAQGKHHEDAEEAGSRFDETEKTAGVERAEQVSLLLGKGQALMHMDKVESAVECFDEVIAMDPRNSEALVKKGTALEKLKRLEDAIKCYDQAIAANNGMTLAYLYKGGVFNQMEKFSEALECYEQALRSQQKPVMST
jgi:tetratricopeptide (TPR) repeat protein